MFHEGCWDLPVGKDVGWGGKVPGPMRTNVRKDEAKMDSPRDFCAEESSHAHSMFQIKTEKRQERSQANSLRNPWVLAHSW